MAKKTTSAKKKAGGKKKGGAKKSAAAKPQAKRMTLHGVVDMIGAFEKAVQGSKHRGKDEMLKLAAKTKKDWTEFCIAMHARGECEKPTANFCEPPKSN